MNAPTVVQELWNYCNVCRDDGMSYGDVSIGPERSTTAVMSHGESHIYEAFIGAAGVVGAECIRCMVPRMLRSSTMSKDPLPTAGSPRRQHVDVHATSIAAHAGFV